MNIPIVTDYVIIAGFAYLAFIPFDKKHIRARWAKSVFAICAVVGITKGVVDLAWHLKWFVFGSEGNRRLEDCLFGASGLLLGFLFSLILSGQLKGTKRPTNTQQELN